MKNLKSFTEFVNESYSDDIYLSAKDIPEGIRDWVKSVSGTNIQRYRLDQSGKPVTVDQPWHQADREIYHFFNLVGNNAIPIGNPVSKSGGESDSFQGYKEGMDKTGKVEIPEGKILVVYGTYPQRVIIHTGPNAQLMLPDTSNSEDLTDEELIILVTTKSLKPFARPKMKQEFYDKLIEKGLLAKNKSITNTGRNLLSTSVVKEKAKEAIEKWNNKKGWSGSYISTSLF